MIQHKHVRSTLSPAAALTLLACLLVAGCGDGGGYGGGGSGGGGGDGYGGDPPLPPVSPTIVLTPPAGGSVNRTVNLSASVTAPVGVTRVEFLVDGAGVGTVTTPPYTFAWDTSAVSNGEHGVTARVADAANNVVTSGTVNVTVNNNPAIDVVLITEEIFPRPASTASGSGTLTFNLIDGAVSGHLTLVGNSPEQSKVSINEGYAGTYGAAVVDFVKNAAALNQWDVAQGSMLTADQIDLLLRGQLYVTVNSAAYPNPFGEIRGQIQTENIDVVFTAMTGDAVVPPVAVNAIGVAATTVDSLARNATVHAKTFGVEDATEAHVRKAAVGANSAATLIALTKDAVAPGRWSAQRQAITAQDRTDFTNGGWYIDVRAPANPGGAIRGQITPNAVFPLAPPPIVTLGQLQDSIFGPNGSICHSGAGGELPGSMNLSSAVSSFNALVNRASVEQPAVLRVAPGLFFLDQSRMDQVRAWITARTSGGRD